MLDLPQPPTLEVAVCAVRAKGALDKLHGKRLTLDTVCQRRTSVKFPLAVALRRRCTVVQRTLLRLWTQGSRHA
jgi:hypothetical protein